MGFFVLPYSKGNIDIYKDSTISSASLTELLSAIEAGDYIIYNVGDIEVDSYKITFDGYTFHLKYLKGNQCTADAHYVSNGSISKSELLQHLEGNISQQPEDHIVFAYLSNGMTKIKAEIPIHLFK